MASHADVHFVCCYLGCIVVHILLGYLVREVHVGSDEHLTAQFLSKVCDIGGYVAGVIRKLPVIRIAP